MTKLSKTMTTAIETLNTMLDGRWKDYLRAKEVWGDREPTVENKGEFEFRIGSDVRRDTVRALVARGILIVVGAGCDKVNYTKRFDYGRKVVYDTVWANYKVYRLNPDYVK